jgi:hypothetical protein
MHTQRCSFLSPLEPKIIFYASSMFSYILNDLKFSSAQKESNPVLFVISYRKDSFGQYYIESRLIQK